MFVNIRLGWGLVWKILLSRLGLFRELFSSNNGSQRHGATHTTQTRHQQGGDQGCGSSHGEDGNQGSGEGDRGSFHGKDHGFSSVHPPSGRWSVSSTSKPRPLSSSLLESSSGKEGELRQRQVTVSWPAEQGEGAGREQGRGEAKEGKSVRLWPYEDFTGEGQGRELLGKDKMKGDQWFIYEGGNTNEGDDQPSSLSSSQTDEEDKQVRRRKM